MTRACAWILAALLVAPLLQSCKSDEEDFVKDFPSECTLKCGELQPLIVVDEDALVVPAAIAHLQWQSDDEDVAIVENGGIRATGLGETDIRLYNSDATKLVSQIHVTVIPTATVTLKAGETVDIKELLPEQYDSYARFYSSNPSVAEVSDSWNNGKYRPILSAESPGETIISGTESAYTKSAKVVIKVKVEKYTDVTYFTMPYLVYKASKEEVKAAMSGYTLAYEGKETLDYSTYEVLRYAPYGNSASVTYYFDIRYLGSSTKPFLFTVIVDTGHDSENVLRSLLSNYGHKEGYPWNDVKFDTGVSSWYMTCPRTSKGSGDKVQFLHSLYY